MQLDNIKQESRKIFDKLEMPSMRYGLTIRLNLDNFDFNKLKPKDFEVDFVKSDEIIIEDLKTALVKHEKLVKEHLGKAVKINESKFIAFHYANLSNGLFIYVPKNKNIELPIEFYNKIKEDCRIEHTLIIVDENSSFKFTEYNTSNDIKGYRSSVVEIFLKQNANLFYGNVQNIGKKVLNFNVVRAIQEKNSSLDCFSASFGSLLNKNDVYSVLKENAHVNNLGVFFSDENQQVDMRTASIHENKGSVSNMFFRGIVKDKAKAIYRGLVKINKEAKDSGGYQRGDILILSDEAEADSIPELEIDNNDVKCSHASSVGQIDRNKLFYLQSRGLSREEATKHIVIGFLDPLMRRINNEKIKKELMENLVKRL